VAFGDGTSQQGEVGDAIAQAVRENLPVLFVIQDNGFAISTQTQGQTFFDRPDGPASEFYGVPITRIDGLDPVASYAAFGTVVAKMREDRKPAIVVFDVERLNSHTNADDHRVYRSAEDIEHVRAEHDPVKTLEDWLLANGLDRAEIEAIRAEVKAQVLREAEEAQDSPDPVACHAAKAELPAHLSDPAQEYRGSSPAPGADPADGMVMLEAIREVLKYRMAKDHRVTLFGEDLEDPKGDVFGVTKGLSQAFPGRVRNSPLNEATIVGYSVGQALAGGRPVAFLQFADFFSVAFNQIWSEVSSMHWRSAGGWKVPMIIMCSAGAFKPGLGPFHASSMESYAAHTPGIDVYLPSSAGDAAGLLNAAFESERPSIFFYPKSLLNDRAQTTSRDVARQLVPIGRARHRRKGEHLTMVGWGNVLNMMERAGNDLADIGVSCDIIDLRSISPWDVDTVVESAKKTGRLLIAQEENHTASMASEISATVSELTAGETLIRRVTRSDTWVPFSFPNQLEVLPSYRRILETAVEMLGGTVGWKKAPAPEAGVFIVEAIGSSPSDESITIVQWKVKAGDKITKGMALAEAEADKAVFEIASPAEGVLEELLAPAGDMVKVGTPLLRIKTAHGKVSRKLVTSEDPGQAKIHLPHPPMLGDGHGRKGYREAIGAVGAAAKHLASNAISNLADVASKVVSDPIAKCQAGIAAVAVRTGSRLVTNEDIAAMSKDWQPEDITKAFGIKQRWWVAEGENALTLAVDAARKVLSAKGLALTDIDLILVATGSPLKVTPSLACMVLAELSKDVAGEAPLIQAVDISAACAGYLYGLQQAHDFLVVKPDARVLLITSETLSLMTEMADEGPVFGDAATASILVGNAHRSEIRLFLERPVLGASGEDGSILRVPRNTDEHIFMDGPKTFIAAVRNMQLFLERAAAQGGLKPGDLDLVIPHQANQRIINAVRQKGKLPAEKVYSVIEEFGNTSSSSIPICLERLCKDLPLGQAWGLVAFGGGFTFGGAILRTKNKEK
jgi:2-oxoisovalerate dehydrogenase E1 component